VTASGRRGQVAASDRKWPQRASGRKWPQVAASGRKWPPFPISNSTPNATPLEFLVILHAQRKLVIPDPFSILLPLGMFFSVQDGGDHYLHSVFRFVRFSDTWLDGPGSMQSIPWRCQVFNDVSMMSAVSFRCLVLM